MGVKLKKQDKKTLNPHSSKLPSPFNKEGLRGPIILLKMTDDAVPCSLTVSEFESYCSSNWTDDGSVKGKGKGKEGVKKGEEEAAEVAHSEGEGEGEEGEGEQKQKKVKEGKRKRKRKSQGTGGEEGEGEGEGDKEGERDEEESVSPSTSVAPLSVYVEGISYDANEDDLSSLFAPCGTISSIRMPRWHDTNRPRGYAHIDFTSEKEVSKALQLDGTNLMKRYITVKRANATKGGSGSAVTSGRHASAGVSGVATVFVKNLPYELEESTFKNAFEEFGDIKNVRLVSGDRRPLSLSFTLFTVVPAWILFTNK